MSVKSSSCLPAKKNRVIKAFINSCGCWFSFLLTMVVQWILWLRVCVCVCKREFSSVWGSHCTRYLLLFSLFWMPAILSFPLLLFQPRIVLFSMLIPNRMRPVMIKSRGFSYSAYLHLKVPEYFWKISAATFYGSTGIFCWCVVCVCFSFWFVHWCFVQKMSCKQV